MKDFFGLEEGTVVISLRENVMVGEIWLVLLFLLANERQWRPSDESNRFETKPSTLPCRIIVCPRVSIVDIEGGMDIKVRNT